MPASGRSMPLGFHEHNRVNEYARDSRAFAQKEERPALNYYKARASKPSELAPEDVDPHVAWLEQCMEERFADTLDYSSDALKLSTPTPPGISNSSGSKSEASEDEDSTEAGIRNPTGDDGQIAESKKAPHEKRRFDKLIPARYRMRTNMYL